LLTKTGADPEGSDRLTVAKPLSDMITKYYWNCPPPPNLTGWIRPWSRTAYQQFIVGKLQSTFRKKRIAVV